MTFFIFIVLFNISLFVDIESCYFKHNILLVMCQASITCFRLHTTVLLSPGHSHFHFVIPFVCSFLFFFLLLYGWNIQSSSYRYLRDELGPLFEILIFLAWEKKVHIIFVVSCPVYYWSLFAQYNTNFPPPVRSANMFCSSLDVLKYIFGKEPTLSWRDTDTPLQVVNWH